MTNVGDSNLSAAVAAHRDNRLAEAEAAYRRIMEISPGWAAAFNLGLICIATARTFEALSWYRISNEIRPGRPETLSALGNALILLQKPDEAEGVLRESLKLRADDAQTRLRLGMALLALGRLGEGWDLYEERPQRLQAAIRRTRLPEWNGDPLAGRRLLVYGEQGLGDEIQMARFVRLLRDRGAGHVTLAVTPSLVRLFGNLGADDVVSRHDDICTDPFDAWVYIASLPHRLAIELPDLVSQPYVTGRADKRTGGVGVMVAANPKGPHGATKTLPVDIARDLLMRGISLAPPDTGARDLQDTADIIAGLDLVVTVDTAVAHLAGAMGTPVWIMLPFVSLDWRWLLGRDDSPWYPSARLYRQGEDEDWEAVVDRVRFDLAKEGH